MPANTAAVVRKATGALRAGIHGANYLSSVASGSCAAGTYTFRQTFTVGTGCSLPGISFQLEYASSHPIPAVRVNGASIGALAASVSEVKIVTVSPSLLVTGSNIIEVDLQAPGGAACGVIMSFTALCADAALAAASSPARTGDGLTIGAVDMKWDYNCVNRDNIWDSGFDVASVVLGPTTTPTVVQKVVYDTVDYLTAASETFQYRTSFTLDTTVYPDSACLFLFVGSNQVIGDVKISNAATGGQFNMGTVNSGFVAGDALNLVKLCKGSPSFTSVNNPALAIGTPFPGWATGANEIEFTLGGIAAGAGAAIWALPLMYGVQKVAPTVAVATSVSHVGPLTATVRMLRWASIATVSWSGQTWLSTATTGAKAVQVITDKNWDVYPLAAALSPLPCAGPALVSLAVTDGFGLTGSDASVSVSVTAAAPVVAVSQSSYTVTAPYAAFTIWGTADSGDAAPVTAAWSQQTPASAAVFSSAANAGSNYTIQIPSGVAPGSYVFSLTATAACSVTTAATVLLTVTAAAPSIALAGGLASVSVVQPAASYFWSAAVTDLGSGVASAAWSCTNCPAGTAVATGPLAGSSPYNVTGSIAAALPPAVYTLRLTVTTPGGQTATADLTLQVTPGAPVLTPPADPLSATLPYAAGSLVLSALCDNPSGTLASSGWELLAAPAACASCTPGPLASTTAAAAGAPAGMTRVAVRASVPACDTPGTYTFRASAANSYGLAAAPATASLVVLASAPAVALPRAADSVPMAGGSYALAGSVVNAAGTVTAAWSLVGGAALATALAGPVADAAGNPTWTATASYPLAVGNVTLRLSATNSHGLSASADLALAVLPVAPSVAALGPTAALVQPYDAAAAVLSGSVAAGCGSLASAVWTDPSGAALATSLASGLATAPLPLQLAPGSYLYTLTATNSYGLSSSAALTVTVAAGAPTVSLAPGTPPVLALTRPITAAGGGLVRALASSASGGISTAVLALLTAAAELAVAVPVSIARDAARDAAGALAFALEAALPDVAAGNYTAVFTATTAFGLAASSPALPVVVSDPIPPLAVVADHAIVGKRAGAPLVFRGSAVACGLARVATAAWYRLELANASELAASPVLSVAPLPTALAPAAPYDLNGAACTAVQATATLATGLPAGTYAFALRAANQERVEAEARASVTVLPAVPPSCVVHGASGAEDGGVLLVDSPYASVKLTGLCRTANGAIVGLNWALLAPAANGTTKTVPLDTYLQGEAGEGVVLLGVPHLQRGAAAYLPRGLQAGTHVLRLQIADEAGEVASATLTVRVRAARGALYAAGWATSAAGGVAVVAGLGAGLFLPAKSPYAVSTSASLALVSHFQLIALSSALACGLHPAYRDYADTFRWSLLQLRLPWQLARPADALPASPLFSSASLRPARRGLRQLAEQPEEAPAPDEAAALDGDDGGDQDDPSSDFRSALFYSAAAAGAVVVAHLAVRAVHARLLRRGAAAAAAAFPFPRYELVAMDVIFGGICVAAARLLPRARSTLELVAAAGALAAVPVAYVLFVVGTLHRGLARRRLLEFRPAVTAKALAAPDESSGESSAGEEELGQLPPLTARPAPPSPRPGPPSPRPATATDVEPLTPAPAPARALASPSSSVAAWLDGAAPHAPAPPSPRPTSPGAPAPAPPSPAVGPRRGSRAEARPDSARSDAESDALQRSGTLPPDAARSVRGPRRASAALPLPSGRAGSGEGGPRPRGVLQRTLRGVFDFLQLQVPRRQPAPEAYEAVPTARSFEPDGDASPRSEAGLELAAAEERDEADEPPAARPRHARPAGLPYLALPVAAPLRPGGSPSPQPGPGPFHGRRRASDASAVSFAHVPLSVATGRRGSTASDIGLASAARPRTADGGATTRRSSVGEALRSIRGVLYSPRTAQRLAAIVGFFGGQAAHGQPRGWATGRSQRPASSRRSSLAASVMRRASLVAALPGAAKQMLRASRGEWEGPSEAGKAFLGRYGPLFEDNGFERLAYLYAAWELAKKLALAVIVAMVADVYAQLAAVILVNLATLVYVAWAFPFNRTRDNYAAIAAAVLQTAFYVLVNVSDSSSPEGAALATAMASLQTAGAIFLALGHFQLMAAVAAKLLAPALGPLLARLRALRLRFRKITPAPAPDSSTSTRASPPPPTPASPLPPAAASATELKLLEPKQAAERWRAVRAGGRPRPPEGPAGRAAPAAPAAVDDGMPSEMA